MKSVWTEENLPKIQAATKIILFAMQSGLKADQAVKLLTDCEVDNAIVNAATVEAAAICSFSVF